MKTKMKIQILFCNPLMLLHNYSLQRCNRRHVYVAVMSGANFMLFIHAPSIQNYTEPDVIIF